MTELEQYQAMLKRCGVPFTVEHGTGENGDETLVHVASGLSEAAPEQLHGYSGFYVDHFFNAAGQLLSVGIWE